MKVCPIGVLDEHGNYHREDGPAHQNIDGDRFWYIHGYLHRLDGPAIEYVDGAKKWYFNNQLVDCSSQEEFERFLNLKAFW